MSLGNPMKPIISSAHSRGPRPTPRRLSDLHPYARLSVESRPTWSQIADQLAAGVAIGAIIGVVVMVAAAML